MTDTASGFASIYIDDLLLNIDNPNFEQMVGQIYCNELQLNKANSFDTEAPPLFDLDLPIANGPVSSKIIIKGMILILKKLITLLLIEMFVSPLSMVYIFRN